MRALDVCLFAHTAKNRAALGRFCKGLNTRLRRKLLGSMSTPWGGYAVPVKICHAHSRTHICNAHARNSSCLWMACPNSSRTPTAQPCMCAFHTNSNAPSHLFSPPSPSLQIHPPPPQYLTNILYKIRHVLALAVVKPSTYNFQVRCRVSDESISSNLPTPALSSQIRLSLCPARRQGTRMPSWKEVRGCVCPNLGVDIQYIQ